ncbi:MAG: hypothetical protein K2Q28_09425 [Hyphomicrobium sp.]|nr:hypothetical protein [Hyphomicrobium sp.]
MLTAIAIALHSFVFLLLPIALYSLWCGSPIPNGPLGNYFRAVKSLRFVGDLFFVVVCGVSAVKLALHLGILAPVVGETLVAYLGFPFMGLLLSYLAMFARAVILVRRAPSP